MNPKEKAQELVDKMYNVDAIDYYDELSIQYKHAIRCALIAVEEVLDILDENHNIKYWLEVKQEIEKL